jgi:dihydroorotase
MLESELNAAAAGGVTSLVCPPDTDPTLDEPGLVEMLKFRARKLSACAGVPAGRADARPGKGEVLTEMAELTEAGCVGFSRPTCRCRHPGAAARAAVRRHLRLHRVAAAAGRWLGKGVAASGALATRLGLSGVPVAAETVALHTIIELVRTTGARVHLCRCPAPPAWPCCAGQGRGPAGHGRRQHQLAAPHRRGHRLLQPRRCG